MDFCTTYGIWIFLPLTGSVCKFVPLTGSICKFVPPATYWSKVTNTDADTLRALFFARALELRLNCIQFTTTFLVQKYKY